MPPADGYFEWQVTPDGMPPYFLHLDNTVLNMAGRYELWRDPENGNDDPARWLWTTVLTTAKYAAGEIHDPVYSLKWTRILRSRRRQRL